MSSDQILLNKLDIFIRKYYKNRLIRGMLFLLSISACFYLFLVLTEYFFHFGILLRTILFFAYIFSSILLIYRLMLVPVMHLMKIGKILTYEQASSIIGQHFVEIQDKLLNTLQLLQQKENTEEGHELLIAGIEQKIRTLKVFSFSAAINFRTNYHYLRYVIPPMFIILILLTFSPGMISEPTKRILRFNETFVKPLPFHFEILNKNLKAMQQEDFDLRVKFTGNEIPAEVFLLMKGISYKMKRDGSTSFSYVFNLLQSDIVFQIKAGSFTSDEYVIKVYPKPIILNFEILTEFPRYLKKPPEKVDNTGDLIVPEGTVVGWKIFTRDVRTVQMSFPGRKIRLSDQVGNKFSYSDKFLESTSYSITPLNEYSSCSDSLQYRITVVKDGFPSIFVNETSDSSLSNNLFFKGTIKDDYGFTNLTFNYEIIDDFDTSLKRNRVEIVPIDINLNNQSFYYTFDLASFMHISGLRMKYYFEIRDNDGLHGPKATRTEIRVIKPPTLEEIIEELDKTSDNVRKDMEGSLKETQSVKKAIDQLNRKMVDQTNMSWNEKKKIEELVKANEKIIEKVEQVKKLNEANLQKEEKYLETSERIQEKQKKLNELMDQMFTEEMKKMMQEMKDLLNKVDKDKLQDLLEKMKMSATELEKQLDQNIELYKQIEFERKLEKAVADLKKTAEDQEKLAEATEKEQKSNEELKNQQEMLGKKFDSIKSDIQKLTQEGKSLEAPMDLEGTKPLQESISQKMDDSKKQIGTKKGTAPNSQREASKAMKDLAKGLESMQEESEEGQLEEDVSNVRMILENLLRLSFDQEALIVATRTISRSDPKYQEVIVQQRDIKEKIRGVEDSLISIGKRQIFIGPIISKEIASINNNLSASLENLDGRNIAIAVTKQQYTMTAINNLANLLSESMDQMNKQMQMNMQSKSGQKSCSKPSGKGGKTSVKNMRDLQQKLSEQLEKMKKGMQKSGKDGKGSKEEQSVLNKQLARMAAQQEALRNEMQRYQDQMTEEGQKDGGALNKTIGEMEENERDMVNKRITAETLSRQQRILTRMLESEKAEQKREEEERRKSIEAKNQKTSNPKPNFQYKRTVNGSLEVLKFSDAPLTNFYKSRVNNYLLKITH